MGPNGNHRRLVLLSAALLAALWLCGACGGEEEESAPRFRGRPGRVRPGMSSIDAKKRVAGQKGTGLVEGGGETAKKKIELPQLAETDFIQSDKRRDPFFPYVEVIGVQQNITRSIQRDIKLEEYDISDLKLIAIITNIGDPRAMVVTPEGTGFVIRRGDYVGRADYIEQGSGGDKIQVNWRVARIHGSGKEEERGVYFIRDDPTTSRGVDMTRFIPLHPRE